MKKPVWVTLIILAAMLFAALLIVLIAPANIPVKTADLSEHLDFHEENNYFYGTNCITDPEVAAKIGTAIIDDICGQGPFNIGSTTVYHDSANGLWKVSRGYLFHPGGFVIIRERDGAIVRTLLFKN